MRESLTAFMLLTGICASVRLLFALQSVRSGTLGGMGILRQFTFQYGSSLAF